MNKIILLFIAFFLLQYTSLAQEGWFLQNSPQGYSLNDVWVINEDTSLAVGNSGLIIKTTNGGQEWVSKFSFTYHNLKNVCFIDYGIGYAVGGWGTILKSFNDGEDWIDIGIQYYYSFVSLCFIDTENGWILGYYEDSAPPHLLRTVSGGVGGDWFIWQYPFITLFVNDIYFVDSMNGWMATGGSDSIFATTNGGDNWFTQYIGGNNSYQLNDVFFIDEITGWAAGRDELNGKGLILKTIDGGNNWVSQTIGTVMTLNSVYFTDDNIGWVIGEGGTILKTTNGGTNWLGQNANTIESLNAVKFANESIGWIVGDNGVILKTINGGVSFVEEEEIDEIPSEYILSNNFPNPFNPATKIKYSIPQISNVVIKVFDILGNEIETLVNEEKSAGTYEITWYAEGLPSGVYFYQLKAVDPLTGSGQGFVETKKMVLMK